MNAVCVILLLFSVIAGVVSQHKPNPPELYNQFNATIVFHEGGHNRTFYMANDYSNMLSWIEEQLPDKSVAEDYCEYNQKICFLVRHNNCTKHASGGQMIPQQPLDNPKYRGIVDRNGLKAYKWEGKWKLTQSHVNYYEVAANEDERVPIEIDFTTSRLYWASYTSQTKFVKPSGCPSAASAVLN